jgi:hypothetical protein
MSPVRSYPPPRRDPYLADEVAQAQPGDGLFCCLLPFSCCRMCCGLVCGGSPSPFPPPPFPPPPRLKPLLTNSRLPGLWLLLRPCQCASPYLPSPLSRLLEDSIALQSLRHGPLQAVLLLQDLLQRRQHPLLRHGDGAHRLDLPRRLRLQLHHRLRWDSAAHP